MIDLMMRHIHDVTGASRVLILRADRTKDPVKVWIEHELLGNLPSIQNDWQGRDANGVYGDLLNKTSRFGKVTLHTESMPAGVLKTLYRDSGVKQSIVLSLGHQGIESYRYLSINFTELYPTDGVFLRSVAVTMSRMISMLDLR